ncbi:LacI family DNA-binding transcriptional regulator [Kiritimatiellaeota bacterium B1221]|nr:LacI family DNA-binding transcriptional regulator [Kiritimatiellaeota bacterium B1221]
MPLTSKVNIRDVAKASGFSVYTVSSVLNNKGDISPETSRKVRQAAQKLNYNILGNLAAARNITTRSIGLVLPNSNCFQHTFYNRAIATLTAKVSAQNFNCRFFTEEDLQRKIDPNQSDGLHELGCGGVLVFCPRQNYETYITQLIERGVVVALVRRQTSPQPGLLQVVDSDAENMLKLINYIHDRLGKRRIIVVGNKRMNPQSPGARSNTFLDFTSKDIPDKDLVYTKTLDWTDLKKVAQFKQFIQAGPPPHIYCMTDDVATTVLFGLNHSGLSIPQDVTVSGYNDDPAAGYAIPGITTMRIPVEEMINCACHYLFENAQATELPPAAFQKFDHKLIKRGSTENLDGVLS